MRCQGFVVETNSAAAFKTEYLKGNNFSEIELDVLLLQSWYRLEVLITCLHATNVKCKSKGVMPNLLRVLNGSKRRCCVHCWASTRM